MRCATVREYLSQSMDGPLEPPDEIQVETHVQACEWCRLYRTTLRRMTGALATLERAPAPLDFGAMVTFQLRRERVQRRWMPPAAVAAALVAGMVLAWPTWRDSGQMPSRSASSGSASSAGSLSADQETAAFMHWMDPSADGGSGLGIQQAAFDTYSAAGSGDQWSAVPAGPVSPLQFAPMAGMQPQPMAIQLGSGLISTFLQGPIAPVQPAATPGR